MRVALAVVILAGACRSATTTAATPAAATPASPPAAAPANVTAALDKLLATNSRALYACLEAEGATRPDYSGHLDAEVEVDSTGRVVNVQIYASTFPDDHPLPCLLGAWRELRLPAPHTHATGRVRLAWESSRNCHEPAMGQRGSIDKEVLRRVVASHLDEVRACYDRGLAANPALAGRVMMIFTIDGGGAVSTSVVASSTVDDAAVGDCIVEATRSWRFPPPCGGGNVVVGYPFVLKPAP